MAITLKAARINKGLTQAEAAERIGISETTLSKYENAKSFPDVMTIKRIEEVYSLEYKDIVFLPGSAV